MKFCIRCDDVGWVSSGKADPGLELARRFHTAMQGLPYLAAVIPASLDDAGRAWLKAKPEGLTVAMHGYRHEPACEGLPCEFDHVSPGGCREIIRNAKSALGVETRHFVAPWNSYTDILTRVLVQEGIMVHWRGYTTGPAPPPIRRRGDIVEVPSWLPTYAATLWQMGVDDRPLKSVMGALKSMGGKAVITLHITWEAVKGDEFSGVKWLAAQIADDAIGVNEYLERP